MGPFVLEEDDLMEGFRAQLQADGAFHHRRPSGDVSVPVDLPLAVGSADHITGLADGRKNGIALSRVEELGQLRPTAEDVDGRCIVFHFDSRDKG